MDDFTHLTWTCEICKEVFPDVEVTVTKHDMSPTTLPLGTITRNVRHCLNDDCVRIAADKGSLKDRNLIP